MTPGRCRPGERYLVHYGTAGRSLCGRTLRHEEPSGTPATCRTCAYRAERSTGVVYLLHFHAPFGHAAHYLGWTSSLERRLWHHLNGTGANLLRHVAKAGITWSLAAVWPGTRTDERAMKNHGHARRCPTCRATASGYS